MTARRPTSLLAWPLVVVVAVLGVRPYTDLLHHYPWKLDAFRWVTRGASDLPDWQTWVFTSSHFVGYRPVAAISYTLNHALAGWTPEMYRATDFALFALATLAVAGLFRTLVARTDAWMALAALLFCAHPAAEEIVPYLARRSYTLSVLFSTVGLALWIEGVRREPVLGWRSLLGSLSLLLGILSNEVAYVVLPLFPLFALHERGGLRQSLVRSLPVGLGALAAIAARFVVIDSTGGYTKRYLAISAGGLKRLTQPEGFLGHRVFSAALDYATLPVGMRGTDNPFRADWSHTAIAGLPPFDYTQVVRILLFLVTAFYLWEVVARPLVERDRRGRTGLLLGLWLIGYALLFGAVRTWFWRQGFPMTVPVALLTTWTLRETWSRGLPRWRLLPQLLFVGSLLWHSPVVNGRSNHKMSARIAANDLLREVPRLLQGAKRGDTVWLVAPGTPGTVRMLRRWFDREFSELGVRWFVLAHGLPIENLARRDGDTLVLRNAGRIPSSTRNMLRIEPGRRVPLELIRNRDLSPWLVWPDEQGHWQAERLK